MDSSFLVAKLFVAIFFAKITLFKNTLILTGCEFGVARCEFSVARCEFSVARLAFGVASLALRV